MIVLYVILTDVFIDVLSVIDDMVGLGYLFTGHHVGGFGLTHNQQVEDLLVSDCLLSEEESLAVLP